jgi:hypothetical protein
MANTAVSWDGALLAFGLQSLPWKVLATYRWRGEAEMDNNYVFLCGVMWCQFGQQEAARELLRAANSGNPDMSALAWAMLKRGVRRLRDLQGRAQTSSRTQTLAPKPGSKRLPIAL